MEVLCNGLIYSIKLFLSHDITQITTQTVDPST